MTKPLRSFGMPPGGVADFTAGTVQLGQSCDAQPAELSSFRGRQDGGPERKLRIHPAQRQETGDICKHSVGGNLSTTSWRA